MTTRFFVLATTAEAVAGTSTVLAVTPAGLAAYVAQPKARTYSGTTDTIVAADVGNVVRYDNAAAVTVALPDLSASLTAGCAMLLTLQQITAGADLTIDPGAGVTIDGSASNFVVPGSRASLISFDGLAWLSGAAL